MKDMKNKGMVYGIDCIFVFFLIFIFLRVYREIENNSFFDFLVSYCSLFLKYYVLYYE